MQPAATPHPASGLDRRSLLAAGVAAGVTLGLAPLPEAGAATPPPFITPAQLQARLARAVGAAGPRVGVTVLDRRTGVRVSCNGGLQVKMASTGKVLVLAALLRRRRAAGQPLSADERAIVARMIRLSDNAAADTLYARAGGSAGLSATARAVGMPVTAASTAALPRWGSCLTTSDEQARFVSCLVDGGRGVLHPSDCAYILAEMRAVVPDQAWGAGILRSPTVSVAVKNGWAPMLPDRRWRVNTIGYVRGGGRDVVLACYEWGLPTMAEGVRRKDAVALAVHSALARPLSRG